MIAIEYFMGFFVVISLSVLLYSLGAVVCEENECDGYKFFLGYLIYSFFIAIGGIIIQVLNLSWYLFLAYMIVIVISLILFILFRHINKKKRIFVKGLKGYFKNNWFLFVVVGVLMFIVIISYNAEWFNNHLDDGYYITRMANMPYIKNSFRFNFPTGFSSNFDFVRNLNTAELEASVYIYLFKITPTLFARFFLAGFNYFLFANVVTAFTNGIIKNSKINIEKSKLQYFSLIIILFSLCENFLLYYNLGCFFDSRQFSYAMYYGSSIVRAIGILMLLTPFVNSKKINIQMIFEVIGISIVLMSKSTIALPIILLVAFSFVFTTIFYFYKNRIFSILLLIAYFIINLIVYFFLNTSVTSEYIFNNIFLVNIKSWFIVPAFIIVFVSIFNKNVFIKRIATIFVCMIIFSCIPICSAFYSLSSVYTWIGARGLTTINYSMIIFSFIMIFSWLLSKIRTSLISFILTASISFVSIFSYCVSGGSLFYSTDGLTSYNIYTALKVFWRNKRFVPNSTIELGEALESYAEKNTDDLNVMMTRLVSVDSAAHSLPIIIRTFAPSENIHIISSLYRYGNPDYSDFQSFTDSDQEVFESYTVFPDYDHLVNLLNMINEYNINCLIMPNMSYDTDLNNNGFALYKSIEDRDAGVYYYMYVSD